ncbi:MAG: NfeD family protein [Desertimonas sp.]
MLDLGIDLDVWPWIWLTVAVVFVLIELTLLAGSFVILPFAVSAFAAAIAGFYDTSAEVQWAIFAVGGAIAWLGMYRWAKRFVTDNQMAPGVGSERLVDLEGIVTVGIDPDDTSRRGRVSVAGEVWGALSATDRPVAVGTHVRIASVVGTRVVVEPIPIGDAGLPPIVRPPGPPTVAPPIAGPVDPSREGTT